MEHKLFTVAVLAILLSAHTDGRSKDPDEDRAYEFGFTIEGMQHRHEKKDVNGIIQGEFGFITADGVYHVTVYATDENGNFRILSMKNIKVSPPLDGSPDYGSSKYSSIPKGPQSTQNASLQPVQVQKRTDVSTTRAPNRAFTTQPTIKPGCAGCGYVTTSKRPPVSNNPSGSFANGGIASGQPQSAFSTGISSGAQNGPGDSRFGSIPSSQSGSKTSGTSGGQPQSFTNGISPYNTLNSAGGSKFGNPASISTSQQGSAALGQGGNTANQPQNGLNNGLVAPAVGFAPQGQAIQDRFGSGVQSSPDSNNGQIPSGNANPQEPSNIPSYSDSFANPQNKQNDVFGSSKPNEHSSQITYRNPDPPVKVTNGVIKVPGNADITIQDKYPGMVDGLPPGVMEKDITDILYRFNWTVGFQGHYETGYKNGAKIGGYFVNGSDGISRVVTYVADEFGYRPKVRIINLGLDSPDTPKDDKTFVLKSFEFVWYPVK